MLWITVMGQGLILLNQAFINSGLSSILTTRYGGIAKKNSHEKAKIFPVNDSTGCGKTIVKSGGIFCCWR
jgi:hypothetical protein